MATEYSKRSLFWYLGMTVLVFFYIYQFSLSIIGLPLWLHSIRVASIVLFVLFFIQLIRKSKTAVRGKDVGRVFFRKIVTVHIFLFLYMLFLYVAIGVTEGDHMVVILTNFFLFSIAPIYICSKLFKNWDEFLFVVLAASLLQSFFIWVSTIDLQIATIFDLVFNEGSDYFEEHRIGYAGGIGCITAPGYIRYSIGQLACFYFAIRKRNSFFFLLYLFMYLTGAMVARTGLFAGGLGIVFLFFALLRNANARLMTSLAIFAVVVSFVAIFFIFSNNNVMSFFEERFARTETMFTESKSEGFLNFSFFENYRRGEGTVIPSLSSDTIIGTGVPSGTAGNGVKVNVDGGFIRLYVAYGLIVAVIFYLFLFYNMLKASFSKKCEYEHRVTLLLTILFFVIAEFKEWSIYASPYIWFFTLLAMSPIAPRLNKHCCRIKE